MLTNGYVEPEVGLGFPGESRNGRKTTMEIQWPRQIYFLCWVRKQGFVIRDSTSEEKTGLEGEATYTTVEVQEPKVKNIIITPDVSLCRALRRPWW